MTGYDTARRCLDENMRRLGIPSTDEYRSNITLALMALVDVIEEDMQGVHTRLDAIERQLKERRA